MATTSGPQTGHKNNQSHATPQKQILSPLGPQREDFLHSSLYYECYKSILGEVLPKEQQVLLVDYLDVYDHAAEEEEGGVEERGDDIGADTGTGDLGSDCAQEGTDDQTSITSQSSIENQDDPDTTQGKSSRQAPKFSRTMKNVQIAAAQPAQSPQPPSLPPLLPPPPQSNRKKEKCFEKDVPLDRLLSSSRVAPAPGLRIMQVCLILIICFSAHFISL